MEGCGYPKAGQVSYTKCTLGASGWLLVKCHPCLQYPQGSPHHKQTALVALLAERLKKVNDCMISLLLQVDLPRMKLGYLSRGGLPVAVPVQVMQVVSGIRNSHCQGNLITEKQDKELRAFLTCSPVVPFHLFFACLISRSLSQVSTMVLTSTSRQLLCSPS